jgi:anti-sigma regulatory factor (Ser/Thr protein kinase)
MSGMRGLNRASDSQSVFSRKRSHSRILEIDTWRPGEIQAVSPTVDRLMRLIEGSQCIQGAERDFGSALREALGNVVVHGNQELENTIHIRCRSGAGNEISIVVSDQGEGFDFGKAVGNSLTSEPAGEHGRGIELKNVALDEGSFKRGSTEIHNGGTVLTSVSLKPMRRSDE